MFQTLNQFTFTVKQKNNKMNTQQLQKRIQILTAYAIISSVLIAALFFSAFIAEPTARPDEGHSAINKADSLHVKYISAERVDIVEPDGNLSIALSNSKTSAKVRFDGKILHGASNRDTPNIIFFDGKGDEVGGLAFANFDNEDSPFQAIRHLAFDGFKQDEVITLSHFVQDGKSRKGVYIYDRPDIPIMDALEESGVHPEDTPEILGEKLNKFREENPERHKELWGNPRRVAIQTNEENQSELLLGDADGNVRLRLVVEADGKSFIEFLDEEENVVKRIEP